VSTIRIGALATSKDVARLAGVSRATVSRALNGSPRVSAETRNRVDAAVAALGYEPDVAARSLVSQRSNLVALSFSPSFQSGDPGSDFYADLVEHLRREMNAAGYDLLFPSEPLSKGTAGYIRSLRARRVAGVIAGAMKIQDPAINALIEAEIPTVFIDVIGQGPKATHVTSDNVGGARMLAEHLVKHGHTRFAIVAGGIDSLSAANRMAGTREALDSAGLSVDPALVVRTDWSPDGAYEATLELLDRNSKFTAVIAHSDIMASGVLRALRERGIRVPDDVSVAAFDGIDLSSHTTPRLTTVQQDVAGIAGRAVSLLLELMTHGVPAPPVVLPTHLVVRESTGARPR
jgi:LacI family transcriptional regulator